MAKIIMQYLGEHPQAMDTAAGIAAWWTKDERHPDVERVGRVLRQLTAAGVLEEVGSGKYVHYRLRKRSDSE